MIRRLTLLSLAAVLGAGCLAAEPKAAPEDIEILDGDESADALTRRLEVHGTLELGQTIDATFATRGYAGWLFTVAPGARIVLDARGRDDSDPVMYLYGPQSGRSWSRARAIAINDDFGGTLDSHLDVRVRTGGTYLVVVREYWARAGAFSLSLGCGDAECRAECGEDDACPTGSACERVYCIRAPCPSFCRAIDPTLVCEVDSDCVAVPTGCCPCSMGGDQRAVRADAAGTGRPSCDASDPALCPAVYL
nr:hypothetical protein [Myxococcota bacterium]